TGEFATDVSDASGMQLLDVPRREWSVELLGLLGIKREMLGKVYESPEVTGFVTKEAAELCRLPAGTPVVAGAGDNAAAAVGMGVVSEGEAFTTIGTSGVVFAHTKQPLIDPLGRMHTFCCAVPGEWHVMGVTQAAGLSMRWLRDTVCSAEVLEAGRTCIDPYEVMTAEAKNSPIGANRLIYLPYLMGERTPHADPDCRGAFIGLSASHTRSDLIRSVMEGVSYSLRDCLEVLAEVGIKPESMKICGGGARSPLWRQMLADVYGLPICQTASDEGPALGAALLAAVGCGIYGSVGEACKAAVTTRGQVLPDRERGGRYGEFYEIYRGLYKSLKDSFRRLSTL
ncbi:MAG: xylulokinase, partial [Candidatus Flemingiibacterium sp.]